MVGIKENEVVDKVTKMTFVLFLIFQCCKYFGPKHIPSEVLSLACHMEALRVFYDLLASIAHNFFHPHNIFYNHFHIFNVIANY